MSRLIDADALIEAHYQYCNEHHGEMDVFLTWSHKLIKDAPTIEPKQADDLISRADAINAIAKYLKEDYALNGQEPNERHARWGASVILENVPSAQHTSKIVDAYTRGWTDGADAVKDMPQPKIVRCKECKFNYANEHNCEYNPEDIVCTYWASDGLRVDDFCSYGARMTERSE